MNKCNKLISHQKYRPLGQMEALHYILSSSANILRNVVVIIELDKSIIDNFLLKLLNSMHNHFTATQLKIKEIKGIAYFVNHVTFDKIDIQIINIDQDPAYSIKQFIENEINTPINTSKSMWKAKILKSVNKLHLLLTFHHSIFDGRSIVKILNYFKSIQTPKDNKKNKFIYQNIENNININQNNSFNQIEAEKFLKSWAVNQSCDITNQQTKILLNDDKIIKTSKLKNICLKLKISINQLLSAIAIQTIAYIYPQLEKLLIHTPLDLTKISKKQFYSDEIGCFIGIIRSLVSDYKGKNLLEIARLYARELQVGYGQLKNINEFSFLELKKKIVDKFEPHTTKFMGGIAISNIGNVSINQNLIKSLLFKDVFFSTSLHAGLGIFVLHILTINDKLNISLAYTSPLLSEKFVTTFFNNYINLCQSVADGNFEVEKYA